jgi:hypothetical protein
MYEATLENNLKILYEVKDIIPLRPINFTLSYLAKRNKHVRLSTKFHTNI